MQCAPGLSPAVPYRLPHPARMRTGRPPQLVAVTLGAPAIDIRTDITARIVLCYVGDEVVVPEYG